MAKSARARSTCAAGALGERLRRVSCWRSSAVSGRRGSVWWRDMAHLGTRGSPHHYTTSHGKRPTSAASADMLVERFQGFASEVLMHPVHELVGRQRPIRLNDRPLAV